MARHGVARQGSVWQGTARRGLFSKELQTMNLSVDISKLNLGDCILRHVCESIIGTTKEQDQDLWQLSMLQLADVVRKQLKKQHGRDITVRIVGCEIHVLTDAEAAEYNPMRFDAGLRLARASHRRLLAVNTSKLSPEQRERHIKNVGNQAHKLSMLRRKSEVPLPATERTTPAMVFGKRKK